MSRVFALGDVEALAAGRLYAERSEKPAGWHDRAAEALTRAAVRPVLRRLRDPAASMRAIVESADRHEAAMRALDDAQLAARAVPFRSRLRRSGFERAIVGECFALVREAAGRVLGQRHFDSQLMAGWALLRGKLIEMQTGEGKTFAGTLPAALVALAGYPVHVITVNDYLAARDAAEMGPLYRFLGLDVGAIVQGMEPAERRRIYGKPIAYCTNKELAFDYLRDRVQAKSRASRLHLQLRQLRGSGPDGEEPVLRGLYYGIVDEADSVLIDEARTPLILSTARGPAEERARSERGIQLAAEFEEGQDYVIKPAERSVTLTDAGRARLGRACAGEGGVWTSVRAREELLTQAVTALRLFHRDQHYVVSESKVLIVDESTGRVMPDRSWELGLHQLIEVKEGCEPTAQRETLARLTYQRLFRRFIRLAGMTGTAREVAAEVSAVYGLDVVRIPLHRPSQRHVVGQRLLPTQRAKWEAVADQVEAVAVAGGRPVLIGTRSVAASEQVSAVLAARGLEHTLLNAKQDRSEAEIVALAGQTGRVTVATNMAGRGTDIRLAPEVARRGGLHVILTEYHESRRIDRQLFGRCARQGDAGTFEAIVALDDEIFATFAALAIRIVERIGAAAGQPATLRLLRLLAQRSAERRAAAIRVQTLRADLRLAQMLAFSGSGE